MDNIDKFNISEESKMIWDFFSRKDTGVFIEVGSGDPIIGSQSFFLEKCGWNGLLIEPHPEYSEALENCRKSKVLKCACGSSNGVTVNLYMAYAHTCIERGKTTGKQAEITDIVQVELRTLDDIIEKEGIKHIDLVSIDVEGYELNVLKGFNLSKHHPSLLLIEDHVLSLTLHSYLKSKGYKLIKRTGLNNWYIPKYVKYRVSLIPRLKLFRKMYLGTPYRVLKKRFKE